MLTLIYTLYREVPAKDTKYSPSEYVPMTRDFDGYAGLIAYIASLTGKTTGSYHIIDHEKDTQYYLQGIVLDARETCRSNVPRVYIERSK